jgi:hypothetical protein
LPARQLEHVFRDLQRTAKESRALANDAYVWSQPGAKLRIGRGRRDWMTEMAYFRVYLAWEVFLEETFVLYLMGRQAPKGRAVARLAFPPNADAAKGWVIPEGRPYANWVEDKVATRAERFFKDGRPFTSVLRANQNALQEARTIRNAVAHDAPNTQEKFENIVRQNLSGTLPPNTTIGSFLAMTRPGVTPPQSFLELYVSRFESLAAAIVPI